MSDRLLKGVVEVLPAHEFQKKLSTNRPLRIKLGADPTAPDLHLGHAVVLSKLRDFQDAGHHIQFVIGDFTARIGDPTGRSKTRPPLTSQEIEKNAQTYLHQLHKILLPDRLEVVYNSSWLSCLQFEDVVKLAGKVTLARIIERDDFMKRFQNNISIGFHELFYPLMQGYDSVALRSDVEIGGTDQTFNLLMGRYLQEQYGQEPQVIMTLPLLEGLDGVQKMSKSLGNYVGLFEPASQAFGKLMSISDELMWRYWLLLTEKSEAEIAVMKQAVALQELHPLECKKTLAETIVTRFWSYEEAVEGRQQFEAVFQKKDYSQATPVACAHLGEVWIVTLLKEVGAIKSSSEGKRLIQNGAVLINNQAVAAFDAQVTCDPGTTIKVGKHRIYTIIE